MRVFLVIGERRTEGAEWWVEGAAATRGVALHMAREAYEVHATHRRLALVDEKPYGGEWGAAGLDIENSLVVEKNWEIRFDIQEHEVMSA